MISFLSPSPNNSFYSGWKFTHKTPPFLICQQPLCFADSETIPSQFWKRGKGKFCRLEACDKNLQRKKARPRQAGVQQSLEGIYKALEELHWEAQHSLLRSAWGRNEHDLSWPWQLCQRMWTTWQASRASEVSHLGHTALHSSTSGKLETLIFFLLASGSTLTPLAHHNRRSDIAHIFVYSSRFFTNTKPHSVCLWVCLYVYICMPLCVYMSTYAHLCVYVCALTYVHTCLCLSVSLCVYVYKHMHKVARSTFNIFLNLFPTLLFL